MHGPYRPWDGLRANPAKILVDPYARRITGRVTDLEAARGWVDDPMTGNLSTIDSLGHVPLSVVTAPDGPRPPAATRRAVVGDGDQRAARARLHQAAPRGAARAPRHLPGAGPPGRARAPERHRRHRGRAAAGHLDRRRAAAAGARSCHNYWGYATLGFLAPHAGYASVPGAEIEEFRAMVAALHAAGIEVILDVVPNHTAEGGVAGTTLSLPRPRRARLLLAWAATAIDADITGTGNTLDSGSPTVLRLVCDAMRHWVTAFGVDGFRIDLASVLGPAARQARSTRTPRC